MKNKKVYIVAVRINGEVKIFQFPTKEKREAFILELKAKGIEYAISEL